MGKIIGYLHHGEYVYVDEDLKGKHREHCLCWRCYKFTPENRDTNCKIASLNFANCELNNLVSPVWECPVFIERKT
jgi:hypothetical protein